MSLTLKQIIEQKLIAYNFRMNTITREPEIWGEEAEEWVPIDKQKLNSIWVEINMESSVISMDRLKNVIESDQSPGVNPIHAFFSDLDPWSQKEGDYIWELAQCIQLQDQDQFINISDEAKEMYLRRWLISAVAQTFASVDDIQAKSQVALVLCGKMGSFKSTFFHGLLPREMRQRYYKSGNLDFQNEANINTYLATIMLYNLDDYLDTITGRPEEEKVKELIVKKDVNYIPKFEKVSLYRPRLTTFCGTVNSPDFLSDPSNARRFIVFNVAGIDLEKYGKIPKDRLWAQAYKLFKDGEKYWYSKEEEAKYVAITRQYYHEDVLESTISTYLAPATSPISGEIFELPLSKLISYLEKESGSKLLISKQRIGRILAKIGIEQVRRRIEGKTDPDRLYRVKLIIGASEMEKYIAGREYVPQNPAPPENVDPATGEVLPPKHPKQLHFGTANTDFDNQGPAKLNVKLQADAEADEILREIESEQ